MKFLGRIGSGTIYNQLEYWGDMHSDLDPGILFLLCLFAICKIALLYYCLLSVKQHLHSRLPGPGKNCTGPDLTYNNLLRDPAHRQLHRQGL